MRSKYRHFPLGIHLPYFTARQDGAYWEGLRHRLSVSPVGGEKAENLTPDPSIEPMNSPATNEMTTLLGAVVQGNAAAQERVVELAYAQLHEMAAALMQKERQSHTLQPTALVHEAILKFFHKDDVSSIPNRAYFFGAMATAMRRILVDHARTRRATKRGGDRQQVPLDMTIESVESGTSFDVLELDELLTQLEGLDARASEVVSLRCFAGLEIREIADQLNVSPSTIDREWRFAKAWLRTRMQP